MRLAKNRCDVCGRERDGGDYGIKTAGWLTAHLAVLYQGSVELDLCPDHVSEAGTLILDLLHKEHERRIGEHRQRGLCDHGSQFAACEFSDCKHYAR